MKNAMNVKLFFPAMFISLTLLFISVNTCHAFLLYEQTLDESLGGAYSNAGSVIVADDFVLLEDATITDVHWYGYYSRPALDPSITALDFQIRFYAETAGLPSTLLYDQIVSASVADSGLTVTEGPTHPDTHTGSIIYEFTADPIDPFILSGGETIWLSIAETDASTSIGNTQWYWCYSEIGQPGAVKATLGDNWELSTGNMAFSLTSTSPIPEPATCLLLLFGMIGLIGIKKKWS